MKRYLILMILTMMLISTKVEATEYSQYLPGGKNYLDEQNITFTSSSMFTNDAIMVKPDTFYTLTLPGTDLLTEDIFLHIEGSTTYLDDNITLLDECVVELQDVHCTFKTTVSENSLSIIIDSVDVLSYYTHYGFEYFQLEEGTSSTSYEAYIPPEIDNIEPIFTGSGAFIKSYRDQISLTEIIQQHIEVIDEIDGNLN
ncbi:MAG: hypothetical protein KJ847_01285, partial [Firmicutes bacterium]|nr:hypothetical protein [Bacillota bacterium]